MTGNTSPRPGATAPLQSRMMSKAELGLLYFPNSVDKTVARRHIMVWIKRCKPLWQELQRQGYESKAQYFPPRMVTTIFEYLGEPGGSS